ncbi:glutamate-5-semialdehyde dehydrogenase [Deinococcus radiodurans]|uniref:Gamma-glutamyl phosphate reductase n=1 Tax=Deinococcus radiodurans (strain ATCC 13939 / DSM 20539 / JCM 16871 / CCUG 27074 / LMG 4051 / NBRC 15346 / NCIMB 9279 / VKM B-1422 / R1) TaxID=243230 RepID=PROA_DEIRA|nr:glutamate-5-semialdehyde dehydrogenase [Deinococcus radiodurans]Q9RTD9.1 RecName: Full=Gamma-glutamyl phosphate reductase; Short=GPR; AltName: Full=Glutamate-5-semialdehyde dehydrogenase; AltName: Full=Glutamyl-gamma-semialdehyde dehydrogenase; Short=GSA dehydrogenase [Deinococcus radiodurans R1 = ATCC 13939 = DSM 20539]AAF11380.1 gamma-glutamyl phosphate reductase [Deinococcus radiodurans R1 = ATCC 13939 = DSM 20539]ANC71080.1 gamma-glutamyl-phosphate reductase [Deinococcus radiodurans R1 = 
MTQTDSLPGVQATVQDMGERARRAARVLRSLPTGRKVQALRALAAELRAREAGILAANAQDVQAAEAAGLPAPLVDRLRLSAGALAAIARDVEAVAALPDPVGEQTDEKTLPSGIRVSQRRVPLGVLGVIYESRPNVTVDVAALALMSGNAAILRGGKETVNSNAALEDAIHAALNREGLPADAVQVIRDPDRARMLELLRLDESVDAIIPRGGAGLHRFCVENATVPVIVGGIGVVHIYLDGSFVQTPQDVQIAAALIRNAKTQKPSACNALDTLLIDRAALAALPDVVRPLLESGVEVRADAEAQAALAGAGLNVTSAQLGDYGTEFLALVASLRTVSGLDEALDFIAERGGHTDVILTRDPAQAERFVQDVDSAAVMVNVSPRFNDGGQLGLGAEVAISTQKLHARGPMGLRELTTSKWVVRGEGQVRD